MGRFMAELFTVRSLVHAMAGSTAGCTAITLFYPLNLVRTRLQLAETGKSKSALQCLLDILKSEGLGALYTGLWGNVCCLGTSNFVYFYIYNGLRAVLLARKKQAGAAQVITANVNLLVSCIAGSVNVLLTNPLWVASMRLTTMQRKQKSDEKSEFGGVLDAMSTIRSREGILALWNGAGASMLLVSNPVFQFVIYEWIKKFMGRVSKGRGIPIRGAEYFLMAAFAKAIATVATYPIQLAQSRLRAATNHQKADEPPKYIGTWDCLLKTATQDGFMGLYRGMEAKLWQTVLAAAFHFLAYEKLIQLVSGALLRQAAGAN